MARQSRTDVSDYVRRKAIAAAELDLLGRRTVVIPAADWERVEGWMNEPARDVPGLRELAAHKPAWRD